MGTHEAINLRITGVQSRLRSKRILGKVTVWVSGLPKNSVGKTRLQRMETIQTFPTKPQGASRSYPKSQSLQARQKFQVIPESLCDMFRTLAQDSIRNWANSRFPAVAAAHESCVQLGRKAPGYGGRQNHGQELSTKL